MSKGFLIYANGEEYIRQAVACAMSIKKNNNSFPVSVLTNDNVSLKYLDLFDHIIKIPWTNDDNTRYQINNRWKTYHATPYDETIVLDSDTLVTENIDYWWPFLSNYDLFFPNKVFTYRSDVVTSNYYRKAFTANKLPNLYAGIHYFKKCDFTHKFFKWIELVNNNWELVYGNYCKEFYPKNPSFDLTVSIVSKILDCDNLIVNSKVDFIKFVHMKPYLQNWTDVKENWMQKIGVYLTDDCSLIIGNFLQTGIFHYTEENFLTDAIMKQFEKYLKL